VPVTPSERGDGSVRIPSAGTAVPPPRPRIAGPLEAFLRHPVLTLLPAILLVAGAVGLGTQRDPEYKSHARITVGNTNVNAFLIEKVVAGNQAIAGSYARAIAARPVAIAAARDAGISPGQAADRLDASQVPGSTLISVQAKGSSPRAAVALANAGATNLITYVRRVNETDEPDRLFKQYQKAQAAARRAERRTIALLRRDDNSRAAAEAKVAQDLARLKAEDLANRYRAASAEAEAASRLTLIAPAADADSDRREVLEQLLIVSIVGGLVLGFALALLRANWRLLGALRRA
jgi:capsular polysaccharide biosynthesis protein